MRQMTGWLFTRLIWPSLAVALSVRGVATAADCSAETRCLVVVGGSIVRHAPVEMLDWHGDWGMAASSADKDFASQLMRLLQARTDERWSLHKASAPGLEANPDAYRLPDELGQLARTAAVVVLQAGDELDAREIPLRTFTNAYAATARALRPAQGDLFCLGTWWTNPSKDQAIKSACAQAGGVFVDLTDVAKVKANHAGNERPIAHEGVGSHPGDAGMKAIAGRIYQTLIQIPTPR